MAGCEYPGNPPHLVVDCHVSPRWVIRGSHWKALVCSRHLSWAVKEGTSDGKPAIVEDTKERKPV